jgi:uncharacterized repeat protein (TIGR03803 family)
MSIVKSPAGAALAFGVLLSGAGHASTFTTLAPIEGSGDGGAPLAAMIDVGGTLYGTAPNSGAGGCGVVYTFNPTTDTESVLYAFQGGSDGCAPEGSLINVGGMLYGTTNTGGAGSAGTVFQIDPTTGKESVLYAFTGGSDGANPVASLIDLKGKLYGTTTIGGQTNQGTVFSVDLKTHTETVLYSFVGQGDGATPTSPLTDVKGMLYGTTSAGGASGAGAGSLFSIDPTTGTLTVVYAFTNRGDGGYPHGGVVEVAGSLYGAALTGGEFGDGGVFKVDPKTGTEKTIYSFAPGAGFGAETPLLYENGLLYGTTVSGGSDYFGTLFSVDIKTGTGTMLHNFGASGDGSNPSGAPIDVGGTLYGVTQTGGTGQSGTIYSLALSSGQESVAYTFTGANNDESDGGFTKVKTGLFAAVAQGGASSQGEVLSINPSTGAVTTAYSFAGVNGVYPSAAMVEDRGLLYGTTKSGGANGSGNVFSFDPTTGAQKVVYSFTGGADGGTPYANLAVVDGKLYGAAAEGGASYYGTIFEVDPKTGKEKTLHSFTDGADGGSPFAGLVNVGGTLYGTTDSGGSAYYGVLFSVDPKTGVETPLYNFTGGSDGGIPSSSLINVGGTLYGVALLGGASGNGVVFAFDPATNTETVVHSFAGGTDGDAPDASLLKVGGYLYGVTSGDFGGYGTLFKLDPATGTETVLHSFTGGSDGGNPNTNLSYIGGTIYGMDATGGAANLGVVFSLKP